MADDSKKTSKAKLEANRANAQKSSGPKTRAGKETSSQNSWQHGLFAKRLFKTEDQQTEDRADYEALRNGVFRQYQPVGPIESYWAERIAAEMLRSLRLAGHEQESFHSLEFIGTALPIDTILRVQFANTRQLEQALKQLERLQGIRKSLPFDESGENDIELEDLDVEEANTNHSDGRGTEGSDTEDCETNPNLAGEVK